MIMVSALLILLAMTTLGIILANSTTSDIRLTANTWDSKRAFYAAEAGVVLAMEEIERESLSSLLKGADGVSGTSDDGVVDFSCCGTTVSVAGGATFHVDVVNDSDGAASGEDSNGMVFVRAEGNAPLGSRWKMDVLMLQECEEGSDGNFRAAVTSNGPVELRGNFITDGRDHDLSGNVLPNVGTLGISTASTFAQIGSADIGGTDWTGASPQDVFPTNDPALVPLISEQNADWGNPAHEDYDMPLTPDEVVGLPAGTLEEIARGGSEEGSDGEILNHQYVTDPDDLTMPLSGVTYVEMEGCGVWNPAPVSGKGILVVHDDETCSVVKNFHASTVFEGIVITDDVIHLNGNGAILGAVYVLTQSPSAGNCLGNGTLDVLFSSEAIGNALNMLARCSVDILSWNYD